MRGCSSTRTRSLFSILELGSPVTRAPLHTHTSPHLTSPRLTSPHALPFSSSLGPCHQDPWQAALVCFGPRTLRCVSLGCQVAQGKWTARCRWGGHTMLPPVGSGRVAGEKTLKVRWQLPPLERTGVNEGCPGWLHSAHISSILMACPRHSAAALRRRRAAGTHPSRLHGG